MNLIKQFVKNIFEYFEFLYHSTLGIQNFLFIQLAKE